MLAQQRIGNKFSEQILGYILSQYFAVVANQWVTESIGQRFRASKKWLKDKLNSKEQYKAKLFKEYLTQAS